MEHVIAYPEWGAKIVYRIAPGPTCEIVDIEVESAHRRHGIGRDLIEQLFKKLAALPPGKEGKVETVYAITRVDNDVAQEFYERLQFSVLGVLRQFYTPDKRGADAVMYGRKITGVV